MNHDEFLDMLQEDAKNSVSKEYDRTVVDFSTGEVVREISERTFVVDKEPEYIKVYVNTMLAFNGLDTSLAPYLLAFCRHMTYANAPKREYRCTVRTDALVREDVAETLHVSERAVYNAIKKLIEVKIFIPLVIGGKKKRGIYFVNPWVVSKGEWKDISRLRSSFEFTSSSSTSAIVDNDGNTRVLFSVDQTGEENYVLPEAVTEN